MKAKSLILILAMTACVAFSAFAESALENRAVNFLTDKWETGNKVALRSNATPTSVTSHAIAGGMTAVNIAAPRQLGFVLYTDSGDEAYMLGYGVTDTLDINNMPPALVEFITSYTEQKRNSTVKKSPTSQASSTYPLPTIDPVEPFIKTKWGQEAPFNGKCPLYQGIRSVTGCDATALGQILHYYKATNFNNFTIEYADERSLEEVSVNFSDWKFDYSKMLDVYEEGKYTQEQADAVAQMMYIAGAACKMKWSSDESSGQWPLVALDKYFNINANFYIRQAISTDFWMHKIQENLAAGKPILYTGTGVSNSAYSSHIFILDGIDSDNYVHVNWGWDGISDGYYDITFCHPDFFSDTADGYYKNQMMICDIEPRKAGESYKERYIATSSTSVHVFNDYNQADGAVTGVTNNSYEALSYLYRVIYRNVDNSEVLYESSGSKGTVFPNWSYLSWKFTGTYGVDLPDGKWEIKLQTFDGDTQEVIDESTIPMRPYLVRQDGRFVEGGYLEGVGEPNPDKKEFLFMSFEPLTDVITKAPFYARVKTRSLLNQAQTTQTYSKYRYFCFTNLATGKKYIAQSSALIYDLNYYGLEYEGVVKILPPTNPDNGFTMPAGEYVVTVVTSNTEDTDDPLIEYSEPIYVTVKGAVDYPILSYDIGGTLMLSSWHYGTDYNKKWNESVKFRRNQYYSGIVSSNNNYNSVVMLLFAREAENPDADEIMITAFNFDPTTGFNAYSTELSGNLYPLEGKYIFYFRYLTPDGERNILPARWDWIDKATGLPAEPTPHFISANPNAGLPMIEVQTLAAADNTIQMTVKNIAQNQFNGKIFVTGFDVKSGNCIQVFTEDTTIASNETRQIEITAQLTPDAVYDLYVRAIATTVSRGATNAPTLTTKPDGSIAHYEIGNSSNGVIDITVDKNDIDIVVNNSSVIIRNMDGNKEAKVYSVDGRLIASTNSGIIEHLTPGVYILTVGNRSAKVLIK
jgi:hypothetical protein